MNDLRRYAARTCERKFNRVAAPGRRPEDPEGGVSPETPPPDLPGRRFAGHDLKRRASML
jgi:hypothetical protein